MRCEAGQEEKRTPPSSTPESIFLFLAQVWNKYGLSDPHDYPGPQKVLELHLEFVCSECAILDESILDVNTISQLSKSKEQH